MSPRQLSYTFSVIFYEQLNVDNFCNFCSQNDFLLENRKFAKIRTRLYLYFNNLKSSQHHSVNFASHKLNCNTLIHGNRDNSFRSNSPVCMKNYDISLADMYQT